MLFVCDCLCDCVCVNVATFILFPFVSFAEISSPHGMCDPPPCSCPRPTRALMLNLLCVSLQNTNLCMGIPCACSVCGMNNSPLCVTGVLVLVC